MSVGELSVASPAEQKKDLEDWMMKDDPCSNTRCTLLYAHDGPCDVRKGQSLSYAEEQLQYLEELGKSQVLKAAPHSSHYKKMAIEPIQYIEANGLSFHEGAIVKYITRWRDKGGIADLEKIVFYCNRLIELEKSRGGPNGPNSPYRTNPGSSAG
jgi:hypothetical protein